MATNHAPPPAPPDACETDPLVSSPAIVTPRLPLYRRLCIGICLWTFKIFVQGSLRLLRLHNYLTSKNQPTFKTFYDVRPNLEVRVFFPPGHSPKTTSSSNTKFPTYINIHGGGFALCSPIIDDPFCTALAATHGNLLVISLSYSLAPRHPFPIPVHDIQALIPAILADASLPIDPARVCLGGFSAGGNLALAAAQHPDVGPRIKAIVPIYPVVDFSGLYKGKFRNTDDGRPDMLARTGEWFSWGYLPVGQDRRDPLLSPIYAGREKLPKRMFFVGAEYDVLCHEAACMARLLAGREVKEGAAGKGEGEIEERWEEGGVRWRMHKGQRHGYTHASERDAEREKRRVRATEQTWGDIAEWLKEVFRETT